MEERIAAFIQALKSLIEDLTALNTLLKDDQASFSQNDMPAVQQSDEKKQTLLMNIANEVQAIQKMMPKMQGGFIQNLRDYTQQFASHQQATADALIASLQVQLTQGYESLIINNKIVVMNLNYLKNIWDRIMALSPEHQAAYEKPQARHE